MFGMNPVLGLEGRELEHGWKVVKRLPVAGEVGAENKTGGNFSVGYIVEKAGKQAFMKVFDITHAFAAPPERIAFELQRISSAYPNVADGAVIQLSASGTYSLSEGAVRDRAALVGDVASLPNTLPSDSTLQLPALESQS